LPTHKARVRVATFPHPYKDVSDLIAGAGPDAFGRMIQAAKPASEWIVDNVADLGTPLDTPEGKQRAAELLFEMLAALPAIERDARVRQLARRLDLPEAVLRQTLNELHVSRPKTQADTRPTPRLVPFVEQRRPWAAWERGHG
jgi:DNA primase